ncbi:MAG: lipopolysaccharide assembly protein LapB [Gammaproteobacteria bacterium]
MMYLLWLLLPLAAASGWYVAACSYRARGAGSAIPHECIKGLNYLLNEEQGKALEIFVGLIEADEDSVEPHFVLAQMFRRRGETDRAIKIHQNLLARTNLSRAHKLEAMLELGKDYLKAGLLDRAEGLFKQVIGEDDNKANAEAYELLRELYEQEKDWQSAIESATSFESHTGKSQANIIAHYCCELGEAKAAAGERIDAEELARKALDYDSNCARASILLGDLAFEYADYAGAIEHLGKIHHQQSTFLALVLPKLRLAFEKIDDRLGYVRFLQEIKHDDLNVSSRLSLIDSLIKQGDHKTAEEIIELELRKPNVPLRIIRLYAQLTKAGNGAAPDPAIEKVIEALDSHLDKEVSHQCEHCGFQTGGLFWCCPGCHGWGTVKPIDKLSHAPPRQVHYVSN